MYLYKQFSTNGKNMFNEIKYISAPPLIRMDRSIKYERFIANMPLLIMLLVHQTQQKK